MMKRAIDPPPGSFAVRLAPRPLIALPSVERVAKPSLNTFSERTVNRIIAPVTIVQAMGGR